MPPQTAPAVGTAPPAVAEPSFHAAWEGALTDLELDVDRAEALLAALHGGPPAGDVPAGAGAWAPPQGLGPLPETMLERAQLVLARQLAVGERLAAATAQSRKQLAVHERLRPQAPARPMFVDAAF